jgi:hypothetical protein
VVQSIEKPINEPSTFQKQSKPQSSTSPRKAKNSLASQGTLVGSHQEYLTPAKAAAIIPSSTFKVQVSAPKPVKITTIDNSCQTMNDGLIGLACELFLREIQAAIA